MSGLAPLSLPQLSEKLPDYIAMSDADVLRRLRLELSNLIKLVEDEIEREHRVKKFEYYRLDRLTFSQKYVRLHSASKSTIHDNIHKIFHDIAQLHHRHAELEEQRGRLDSLLAVAVKNQELKDKHESWPRPYMYILDPKEDFVLGNTDTDFHCCLQEVGEGIVIKAYKPSSACISSTGAGPSVAPDEGFDDDYQVRLEAELRRLKIARAIQLRMLGCLAQEAPGEQEHAERLRLHININKLNVDLIEAAQALQEAKINRMPRSAAMAECARIRGLTSFEYVSALFGDAGVEAWTLTAGEEKAAAEHCRRQRERCIARDLKEAERQATLSSPERDQEWLESVHCSEKDVSLAINLGPECILQQWLVCQRALEQRLAALDQARDRYDQLSLTQKYLRGDSRSKAEAKVEIVSIAHQVDMLQSSSRRLRDLLVPAVERAKSPKKASKNTLTIR